MKINQVRNLLCTKLSPRKSLTYLKARSSNPYATHTVITPCNYPEKLNSQTVSAPLRNINDHSFSHDSSLNLRTEMRKLNRPRKNVPATTGEIPPKRRRVVARESCTSPARRNLKRLSSFDARCQAWEMDSLGPVE